MVVFLLTKFPARLRKQNVCTGERYVGPDHDRRVIRCSRPIWGDGKVDGIQFDFCSRCFYEWVAFRSGYRGLASD